MTGNIIQRLKDQRRVREVLSRYIDCSECCDSGELIADFDPGDMDEMVERIAMLIEEARDKA